MVYVSLILHNIPLTFSINMSNSEFGVRYRSL